MINPNGSNVPEARNVLRELLAGQRGYVDPEAEDAIRYALSMMTRQKPVRMADRQQTMPITKAMVAQMFVLAQNSALSNADIAVAVGLPTCASGRVSECLQGLRKGR